ncbi:VOC family protein [Asticcacaulis machinosus]|uniref:VOC family protein n=1 Tax=Asticcacaulis machinosus TaxID=2984211 RepID=A0ABT5HFE2_9CAUL|nr:VOC family protein [Asticcacaulis machinosus]MDC7674907.1 VOC family protein [Asticcacaulis machinosus]
MPTTRSISSGSPFLPQTAIEHSAMYTRAMERLVQVVQALSNARDVNTVIRIARDAARELLDADGATFVLREGDKCYYVDETAIAPLWKGKRFPIHLCVSGWVMINRKAAVIEDIYADDRVPQEAYRLTFVQSMTMVPIRRDDPIGAIGAYWAINHRPSEEEMLVLQALADTVSVAMENALLYADLKQNFEIMKHQQARIAKQSDDLKIMKEDGAAARLRPEFNYIDLIVEEEHTGGAAEVRNPLVTPDTPHLATFLMFDGVCEEAVNFYTSLFKDSEIILIKRYGPGEAGREGSVAHCTFVINRVPFIAIDSSVRHEFAFTPAISLYMVCESEGEINHLYEALVAGGEPLMSLADYGFSRKYGWVKDRFGVSWQLNLP